MKKINIFVIMICLLAVYLTLAAGASSIGSISGNYYYTDIVTYLWGVPVNSINIGGVALIDAESMCEYGFTVTWHPDRRWLEIVDDDIHETTAKALSGELLDKAGGKTGKVAGKYYYTDIVTTFNGTEVQSFNIGGRTFIAVESATSTGFSRFGIGDFVGKYIITWDGAARTLSIAPGTAIGADMWSLTLYDTTAAPEEDDFAGFWLEWTRDWLYGKYNYGVAGYGMDLLSNLTVSKDSDGSVRIIFSLYQNLGLFKCNPLREQLDEMVCYRYGEYFRDPAEVYDALNSFTEIYINGTKVSIKELKQGQGNGHADYTFVLDADFGQDYLDSIAMRCGTIPEDSLVYYESDFPEVTDGNRSVYQKALDALHDLWNFEVGYGAETGSAQ